MWFTGEILHIIVLNIINIKNVDMEISQFQKECKTYKVSFQLTSL